MTRRDARWAGITARPWSSSATAASASRNKSRRRRVRESTFLREKVIYGKRPGRNPDLAYLAHPGNRKPFEKMKWKLILRIGRVKVVISNY